MSWPLPLWLIGRALLRSQLVRLAGYGGKPQVSLHERDVWTPPSAQEPARSSNQNSPLYEQAPPTHGHRANCMHKQPKLSIAQASTPDAREQNPTTLTSNQNFHRTSKLQNFPSHEQAPPTHKQQPELSIARAGTTKTFHRIIPSIHSSSLMDLSL